MHTLSEGLYDQPMLGEAVLLIRGAIGRLTCAIETSNLTMIRNEVIYSSWVIQAYRHARKVQDKGSPLLTHHWINIGDNSLDKLTKILNNASCLLSSSIRRIK